MTNILALVLLGVLTVCTRPVSAQSPAAEPKPTVVIQWDKVLRVSKTTPSLLVMATNPLLRRGSPIHSAAFKALAELRAEYVSHLAWYPYPKLAVAELDPPKDGKTFWDFSHLDPLTIDFLEANKGRSVVLNFSTIPQWMFKTEKPVAYPQDPAEVMWTYQQGTELRDPSLKELADYYGRLAGWYTQGGFTDEFGKRHQSGHRFKIDYWGVLNEVDIEHATTPEQYNARYDAIVETVRRVNPDIKFAGLMLALPTKNPRHIEYFLDPKNHKPGIPLDMVGLHFYALPTPDQSPEVQRFTVFEQVDKFVDVVRYVERIRMRLSPSTRMLVNELGIILPDEFRRANPGFRPQPIPESYRNLFAAVFAYSFAELARLGIDITAESQLVGSPGQFPSVTMIDWESGQPNSSYWVLKLIVDHFSPGNKLVEASAQIPFEPWFLGPPIHATGFITKDGSRKILLVNKRDRPFDLQLPGGVGATVQTVDQTTGSKPPSTSTLKGDTIGLGGLAVAVVTLPVQGSSQSGSATKRPATN